MLHPSNPAGAKKGDWEAGGGGGVGREGVWVCLNARLGRWIARGCREDGRGADRDPILIAGRVGARTALSGVCRVMGLERGWA